jgi:hypothetical protein
MLVVQLAAHHHLWLACGAALLTLFSVALGTLARWRRGEIELAWHCPRLDATEIRPGSRELPWEALRAADAVLGALESDAGELRSFFPGARAELIKSACRLIDAHRNLHRAQAALAFVPEGEARQQLNRQVASANAEKLRLLAALRELRARLVAATRAVPSVDDPLPSIEALTARSSALSGALDELDSKSLSEVKA